jgi:hypothetical protein
MVSSRETVIAGPGIRPDKPAHRFNLRDRKDFARSFSSYRGKQQDPRHARTNKAVGERNSRIQAALVGIGEHCAPHGGS